MTEAEAFRAVERFLAAINAERRFIDPAYEPLTAIVRSPAGAPRKDGPYALVTFIGSIDNGEADHFCYDEAVILARSEAATDAAMKQRPVVTEARVRSVAFKFRIDVFAGRALDYATVLNAAFRSSRATVDLGGMTPRDVGRVDYMPQLIGQEWEGRAKFEVELVALSAVRNAIDVIESGAVSIETASAETSFTFQKG